MNILLDTDLYFFFFNDTATTEIYTLSLHDALPISAFVLLFHGPDHRTHRLRVRHPACRQDTDLADERGDHHAIGRSEEHTSELQSRLHLVCRLLLEKKK